MTSQASQTPAVATPIAPSVPGILWTPTEGEEARGILARSTTLDAAGRQSLLEASAQILGSGVEPGGAAGSRTGLVVGLVQSGKTMSFTTVMALARDNDFPIVILIAGNKDNLLTQSHTRLARDLDTERDSWPRAWKIRKNIRGVDQESEQLLRQTLAGWQTSSNDDERATLILTVLKQKDRLAALTELLKKFDLSRTHVLIVDDEADQASLNTKVRKGLESTTYTRLRELREAVPCHTYLQYTATPQAPLLINIADTLSPDFVRVLEPGGDYVGGAEFFDSGSPYVLDIPVIDLPVQGVMPADPPESMLEAMRVFFVGLALGKKRRSMLIHPSRIRNDHREVTQWASAAIQEWATTLELAPSDPDRQELIADFQVAYDELATTAQLPPFQEVEETLLRSLKHTTVIEFNTNGRPKTPEIDWKDALGWILVGGQAVDRGFTVDALTVTYMPRSIGGGNADTLQQRARFFGYKRPFLGICRIYLDAQARTAFESYVEHENIMRNELARLSQTGTGLQSWRRRFVLDPALKPCRTSVIADDFVRMRRSGGWQQQRGAVITRAARQHNAQLLARLAGRLSFAPDTTYTSSQAAQQHLVARAPLQMVVDTLTEYQFEDPRDTAGFTGLLLVAVEALRRNPNLEAAVYQMRPGVQDIFRTVDEEGNLAEGFLQGHTARQGGGMAYPGDTFFAATNQVSLQIHHYDLHFERATVAQAAPLIATYVPAAIARAWLVQIQQGQAASA
ncbi:hypothetical protein JHFBIEKO_2208 [Methylobacterium mesophilicum]|uniref:Z1 domain-containing protein n=1 Tax=Methylobacterium mesophilicum TaxID=39956 RepID=UPI001EE1D581|nr:Z1 domain-containing protein [Methylobacterium mesophilicum]GJE21760.1 hypothetical protein JHFBIEKO_2208 [Methylobacterium mesophilicum]